MGRLKDGNAELCRSFPCYRQVSNHDRNKLWSWAHVLTYMLENEVYF